MKILRIKLQDDTFVIKNFQDIPSNLGDITAETQIRDFMRDMVRNGGWWPSNSVWIPYHEVKSANFTNVNT
jgi:hypothetical protein